MDRDNDAVSAFPDEIRRDVMWVKMKWLSNTMFILRCIGSALAVIALLWTILDVVAFSEEFKKTYPILTDPIRGLLTMCASTFFAVCMGWAEMFIGRKKDRIQMWCFEELTKGDSKRSVRANGILNETKGEGKGESKTHAARKGTAGGKTSAQGTTAAGGEPSAQGTTADGGKTSAQGTTADGGETSAQGTTADGGKTSAQGTTADGGETSAQGTTADGERTPDLVTALGFDVV